VGRNAIEAGLHDCQQRAFRDRFEAKLDQRGRLVFRVGFRVDAVGRPLEAEVPLGLDALDGSEHGAVVGQPHLRRSKTKAPLVIDDGSFIDRPVEGSP